MASMVCPHCGHLAHFKIEDQRRVYASDSPEDIECVGYMTCAHCGMPVALAANGAGVVLHKWPLVTSGREYPEVPDEIAAVANAAHRCHEVSVPRAASTMARAVVEAIARDKNASGSNLMAKIDALAA